ncbi:MAG: rod shape-determining protein MreC [Prevotellaceae bacterium]|nr:rod shape-determining protein MreC [Candidatus Minthosoma caballi]
MRALIDLLINGKHWFLFLLLEAVSLFSLFSYNGYQKSVYFTTANDVAGTAYSIISSVTSYLYLQTANQRLEADNQRLYREIAQMKEQMAEAGLDTIHPHGLPTKYDFVNAQIVNATTHKTNNLITINKGEADGIRPEMGVVCSRGVVGVVYLTSKHYSIVLPLINVNSKVSCRLRGSDYFGTLNWHRGSSLCTYATGIPRHADVKKREIVETNGYSDIFPPGLPIGLVADIGDSPDGMSYLLTVKMFADFATMREVSVITNYTKPERRELEQVADSLMKSEDI